MRTLPFLRSKTHTIGLFLLGFAWFGCDHSNRNQLSVDPKLLEAYAGEYQPAPDTVVTVKRTGKNLSLQVNHQPGMPFVPETQDSFLHPESSSRIHFRKDGSGQVTYLLLIRDGRTNEAKKITQPTAEGQLTHVPVDGRDLRFLKLGHGSPTVVLWGSSDPWRLVQLELATSALVVSFDGAASAPARPAVVPKRPSDWVRELHEGLARADIPPPYILVGHSFSGACVRVFANLYPQEVIGLVLVDPFQEGFVDWLKSHQAANYNKFVHELSRSYVSDWEGSLAELRGASAFPNLPVVLLSATQRKTQTGNSFEQGISSQDFTEGSEAIVKEHRDWLSQIPGGRQVLVEGSSHDIPRERPEMVSAAIRTLIEQLRKPER